MAKPLKGKPRASAKRTVAPAVAPRAAPRPRRAIVPDTSIVVDGRVTRMIQAGELSDADILVPLAVVAELEYQANSGRESGFNGLDEIVKVQELKEAARVDLRFVGERPLPEEIELAKSGELDAMIRDEAREHDATLLTSDRVQAHVARAMGLKVQYLRPLESEALSADVSALDIMRFFTPDTMSVHLKYRVPPMAKRGTPGDLKLVRLSEAPMELRDLTRMRREIIEAAVRDADSFVEIERLGATVVQLQNMRIAIAQPPFSDGIEITAVRPVTKLSIEDYAIPEELKARLRSYQRGVFVSGPPGSGKSTFVTAVAEWLKGQNAIVKTMESPRDLQVSDEITQYAPLERDMELTSDVLLLVRPDFVVYDEVRKTTDFEIFADMRLAGVGLVGVTHANRGIDAVQRLIGRVELGMIPQVVDTVIHIEKGVIHQVLELSFTVKVPFGMKEADLARPVIEVKDFQTGRVEFEIYTYGEQVVVMPVKGGGRSASSTRDRLASRALREEMRHYVQGRYDVEFTSEASVTLLVEEWEIPRIIGKGGKGVQALEHEFGVKIDVRPLATGPRRGRDRPAWAAAKGGAARSTEPEPDLGKDLGGEDGGADEEDADEDADETPPAGRERRYATVVPELRKSKKNLVLVLKKELSGQSVSVTVDDEVVFTATVGAKGEVRVSRRTDAGQALLDAVARGALVTVRV